MSHLICPHCGSENCIKNGKSTWRGKEYQKFTCRDCHRSWSHNLGTDIRSDKKLGEFNWREWCSHLKQTQALHEKASYSQDFAVVDMSHIKTPILLVAICDLHFGAKGTDYGLLVKITDEIINTPGLYVALAGDILETAIKLRNVKEVAGQIIEPEMQLNFLESWLEDIKHKVLFATWDNHSVSREEGQVGYSVYKRIVGKEKAIIYHNGIGHVDIKLGKQTYKIVSSHGFVGKSILNPLHGQMRYMRFDGQDREIAVGGHTHKPGFNMYYDGNIKRCAINGGSLLVNSGYTKRYFSLFTIPEFPCVELFPDEHNFVPYLNVGTWRALRGR